MAHLYGLLGHPLSHSFSKKYFDQKFTDEGLLDCVYSNFDVATIKDLKEQLPASLEGLNVTIPYKEEVLSQLHEVDPIVEKIRACNCIKIRNGKWKGYNTDVTGFEISLKPLLSNNIKALVLGTGGASKAVGYVLQKLGIAFSFVSTSKYGNGVLSYSDLTQNVIQAHLLIINTTPVGTFPKMTICPDIPYQFLTSGHILYDLIYNPEKSLFLAQGEENGSTIKNGYEMLQIQAEESWRIWRS